MILSCIDLVIAALGEDVKGCLLAHASAAQMGMARIFYPLRGVYYFF